MRKREKIWYIRIAGKEEGPFSFIDLRCDPRITPEVEAKKKEWPHWVPVGKIAELKDLFEDSEPLEESTTAKKPTFARIGQNDELTISLDPQNPLFLLLLLLVLLLAFISLMQFL